MNNKCIYILCLALMSLFLAGNASGYEITPLISGANGENKPDAKESPSDDKGGFKFGSYGRVQASSDFHGGQGKAFNVVAHGPRLEQKSYLELEFRYDFPPAAGTDVMMVSTLAFGEELFHYNTEFEAMEAIRNLYIQANNLFTDDFRVWAGSRMYRGDDIYLFDFWPLDNLNTYGGGLGYTAFDTAIDWHIGFNRANTPYQTQYFTFAAPELTTRDVLVMERQKLVTSLKLTHFLMWGKNETPGLKLKLYGEAHALPEGELIVDFVEDKKQTLPNDKGFLFGGQVGLWNFGYNSFANLFARYATGLAAYGEMGTPFDMNNDKTTGGAREFVTGLSANYQFMFMGFVLGSYVRYFKDADISDVDLDDKWEFVASLRPHLFIHKNFYFAFEISYQLLRPNGLVRDFLEEAELQAAVDKSGEAILVEPQYHSVMPAVFKASVIPTVTLGGGTYGRPVIRLIATMTAPNNDAKLLLDENDPRLKYSQEYFIGIGAEWWFNSTSYN